MGSVYLAYDKNLADAPRAVKEMIEMFADPVQREKAIEDFKREATLLAKLEHPSVPTVFDYFFDQGRYYLVMKFIYGSDLQTKLKSSNGRIDEATVTDWAIQTCDVLHYIHSQNPPIIYRDLKPANLMLDERTNRVMLVDFGIARFVAPTQKGVTAIGTMGYAPPELFSGNVEARSDIYSLGATMFHLLTGADPQDNPLLIFDFSKNPRPRQINPAITPEMERILMRATEYKIEKRFSSALEMKQTLEAHKKRLMGAPPAPPVMPDPRWVFCGNCGQQIAADDIYCAHCGFKQPAPPVVAPRTAKLVVVGTGDMAAQFVLDRDSALIGRKDPNTGIFPEIDLSQYDPDTKVSRRHARIIKRGDQYLIEDNRSVNGTFVNGIKLYPQQPRLLQQGDEIKLGETTLKFLLS